ncbi:MAG: hypothetical protein WA110_07435, partial [Anaerolineaceae bacterium]
HKPNNKCIYILPTQHDHKCRFFTKRNLDAIALAKKAGQLHLMSDKFFCHFCVRFLHPTQTLSASEPHVTAIVIIKTAFIGN